MRRAPERWLDPARGPNPVDLVPAAPRSAPTEDHDPRDVTYHMGRAYLNESSNHVRKDMLTPDERATMQAHRLAEAKTRQADNHANLARAVELGAALKVLAGKDD